MRIRTKCDVGETVWCVVTMKRDREVVCTACGGTGEIKGDGDSRWTCMGCTGRGWRNIVETNFRTEKMEVVNIFISGSVNDGIEIDYELRDGREYVQEDVFFTKSAAMAAVKKREVLKDLNK